ncbi:MAG: arginine--tRNA ligase [Bacteroidota bacterium]|nr:arginine--tRNA ligase [Bacteroidota bacterium]
MTDLQISLQENLRNILKDLYDLEVNTIEFQATRRDFEGDLTLVVFPFTRSSKKSPEVTAEEIGKALLESSELVSSFNVVKGFLNLVIDTKVWSDLLQNALKKDGYGIRQPRKGEPEAMVEYSSPNTNKPLHLGHIRNNLLGYSISRIIGATGKGVKKVQIINDRGIHICKSMVAWKKFSNGETPESSGMKGDKLVGKYYVAFDRAFKEEVDQIMESGLSKEEAGKKSPIMIEAQEMLRKWESGDLETVALWERMNQWVYDGFDTTYDRLGVDFDRNYYESQTYLLGKKDIEKGLERGVFFKKEDGSVWIDLTDEGLDEKLVLRGDGTSVYITQDIGTAIQRFEDFPIDRCVYVVGNEQDYHFKVLFLILKKLGYEWAEKLYHLSYGMVDLPSGKMKSREGTVVDADDLIDEMEETAGRISEELGKTEGLNDEEKRGLYHTIGMGALKYFILKVDPKKRMMFNPEESIDFNGNTGPFIQYTHARIQSLKRKGAHLREVSHGSIIPNGSEVEIIKNISRFEEVIDRSAEELNPSLVANYIYDLVKLYNAYYQQYSVLNADSEELAAFRLSLSDMVGRVVRTGMELLGIDCPDRM